MCSRAAVVEVEVASLPLGDNSLDGERPCAP
jgi:hypothetical protein